MCTLIQFQFKRYHWKDLRFYRVWREATQPELSTISQEIYSILNITDKNWFLAIYFSRSW